MLNRKVFVVSSSVLAASFVLFVFFYWHYVNNTEQKRVDNHSRVIANAIWHFEVGGMMEYMNLASEAYNYKHVIVTQSTGEVVLELEHSFRQPIDRLFDSIKLLPAKIISSNITYNGEVIGKIRVVWQNTAIYIYFYVFILTVLIIIGLRYYLRTIMAKNELEERVVERTASLQKEIQDRIHAEKALRVSHERFLAVLNSLDATIYVADLETYEILFVNKYMIESFGSNMTGETCWKVFRNEEKICSHCNNSKLVDENGKPTGVRVWQDKNPITEKWYINYDRVIEWTDGRLVKLQIATDITDFRKMQEELRQAQKMESIGNLAGGIAHDFNNLLYPIIGYSELLKEDLPQDSPERESAKEIFNAGRRGAELVKQILAFSRQTEHKLSPVRFQKILKEVLKLTRSTIPSDIEIFQNIQKDCGLIMGEATQLHQIAMNLITNAYHAVEKVSGEISVQLKEIMLDNDDLKNSHLQPGQYVMLSVSDNGIGIPKKLMNNIFEPYFTTKEQGKGTGLGLAVVYGILTEHKGDIKVYSKEGKGTTFNVYLPLMMKSDEAILTEEVFKKLTGTERLLLVDDEESVVRLEKQMLERLGYNVSARTNSLEALETFNSNPDGYDLVISDMTMPNLTGDQLAQKLMSIRPDIPIVICTGFSERINKEQAEANKVKGFLMKPVVKSEMAQMVRKVLDEAKE